MVPDDPGRGVDDSHHFAHLQLARTGQTALLAYDHALPQPGLAGHPGELGVQHHTTRPSISNHSARSHSLKNAVAYGLTPSVKERWASLRRKVIEESSCNSLCATEVLADDNDTEELQTGESSTAPNPLQEDADEETAVSTKETEMS